MKINQVLTEAIGLDLMRYRPATTEGDQQNRDTDNRTIMRGRSEMSTTRETERTWREKRETGDNRRGTPRERRERR
ncbi:hypothetical protein L484_012046 [Morus notabilis]|uniref:Uncharacterized protein n=1 Tax=Morus notabilis TaxID=981085 RepID=W9QSB8_9ROSA|nr:hypothetical protein L484_012046 [Morus notabilis]